MSRVKFDLPVPTGRHEVGVTELHLVDQHRADPWKPDRNRELMISIWYPARDAHRYPAAPWISTGLIATKERFAESIGIAKDSVDWGGARSRGRQNAPFSRTGGERPVVLYSPGLGAPRTCSTAIVEDLASRGYVVVTIDHTYEATIEFPGSRVELAMPIHVIPEQTKKIIDVRVADIRYVLDILPLLNTGINPDAQSRALPQSLCGSLNLTRIGIYGHSYGGFASGETMYYDHRINAGISLDGSLAYGFGELLDQPYLPGEVTKCGLDRPFMLMGSERKDSRTGSVVRHTHLEHVDKSWPQFWANQRGWKRDLLLSKGGHNSYTDYQVILPQLASPMNIPVEHFELLIGTVDAKRSVAAQRAYIADFFDLHLQHRDSHLFDGPSPRYPDIKFIA